MATPPAPKPSSKPTTHALKLGTSVSDMRTKCGYALNDKRVAKGNIGTTLAQVNCVSCRAVIEVENELHRLKRDPVPDVLKPYYEWALTGNSGMSSKTLVQAITGATLEMYPCTPSDPSDFGRCYGVLKLFPELRSQLHIVAEKHPEWRALVEHWDELEQMYEAALASGTNRADAMWQRMREIGRAHV